MVGASLSRRAAQLEAVRPLSAEGKEDGTMTSESGFRIAFWVLLAGVLLMRIYSWFSSAAHGSV